MIGRVVHDAVTGGLRQEIVQEFALRDEQAAMMQNYIGQLEGALHDAQYVNDVARAEMAQAVLGQVQMAAANGQAMDQAMQQGYNQVMAVDDMDGNLLGAVELPWQYVPGKRGFSAMFEDNEPLKWMRFDD